MSAEPVRIERHEASGEALAPCGDTRFPIGSVSKLLAALLTVQLGELGWIDLDDPLGGATGLTLRRILAHRSGLPFERRAAHWGAPSLTPAELAEVRARAPRLPLPPATWHYSNLGYAVLAETLEQTTGRSYSELLREYVTGPLGMPATSYPEPAEGRLVLGAAAPAGDLWSTADDLLVLGRALEGPRDGIVGNGLTALIELLTPTTPAILAGPGFELQHVDDRWVLVSRGTLGTASCCLTVWSRRGVSVLADDTVPSGELASRAITRWREAPRATREWWLDGQRVVHSETEDRVELVLRESLWPVPLFSGVRRGDELVGTSWTGEPARFVETVETLTSATLRLTRTIGDSAYEVDE